MSELALDAVTHNRRPDCFAHDETDGRGSAGSWNAGSGQNVSDKGGLRAFGSTTNRVPEVRPGAHALSAREQRLRQTAWRGPCGGDLRGSRGRPGCAYGGGNGTLAHDYVLWFELVSRSLGRPTATARPRRIRLFMGTRQSSFSTTTPRYVVCSQAVKLIPIRHLTPMVHATRREPSTSWGKPLVCAPQGC